MGNAITESTVLSCYISAIHWIIRSESPGTHHLYLNLLYSTELILSFDAVMSSITIIKCNWDFTVCCDILMTMPPLLLICYRKITGNDYLNICDCIFFYLYQILTKIYCNGLNQLNLERNWLISYAYYALSATFNRVKPDYKIGFSRGPTIEWLYLELLQSYKELLSIKTHVNNNKIIAKIISTFTFLSSININILYTTIMLFKILISNCVNNAIFTTHDYIFSKEQRTHHD